MTAAVNHNLWTGSDVALAVGGIGRSSWTAGGVSIDSRSLNAGDLFVALTGPQFDGHQFLGAAFDSGAAAAIINQDPATLPGINETSPCLRVDDGYQGLVDLAHAAVKRSSAKRIAVTGSVGKTGTKEMLAKVLGNQGITTATIGNLNNHIGLPLSLARMPESTEFGIFELGMNAAGEIETLSRIVKPDVAIITRVELVHSEFFKSRQDIARAKAEIFNGMDENGVVILNADDLDFDLLKSLADQAGIKNIITFAEKNSSDIKLIDVQPTEVGQDITITLFGRPMSFSLGLYGRHWAMNAMAVLAAVHSVGGDVEKAANDLKQMTALPGRGLKISVELAKGSFDVIDESYNASPASMIAAINVLAEIHPVEQGRRIAIIGDMLELGDLSKQRHAELKNSVLGADIDLLICVGKNMKSLWDVIIGQIDGAHFENSNDGAEYIKSEIKNNDVVMVKGSKGSRMDIVVDALKNLDKTCVTHQPTASENKK